MERHVKPLVSSSPKFQATRAASFMASPPQVLFRSESLEASDCARKLGRESSFGSQTS